ncbi:vacuolar ATP synthase subunit E [Theileria orientalis]|uniref:Vacuolar ATP synthase subunit E n=1 Tax=Theileria orientalis TaxID=68886 RepID=A0A976QQ52_THEOR|nr:vacuolar ATP synthase subunit E [Theileria orientalis]
MDALEAQNQIKQMVDFILNEAKDKAEEIESGAIEEFNIEKMTLFEQRKDEVRSKILKNINALRLEKIRSRNKDLKEMSDNMLHYQSQVVEEIKAQAMEKLNSLAMDNNEYKKVLTMLTLSGCLALNCEVVMVRHRARDAAVVESTLEDVKHAYEKVTKQKYNEAKSLNLNLDTEHPLAEDLLGVILTNEEGTIECNSTLNNRLERCCREMIPHIKSELFSSVQTK